MTEYGVCGVRMLAVKSSPCINRSFLVCIFFMNKKKVPAAPAAPANGGYPVYDVFPSRFKPRHPSPPPQLPAGDQGAASPLPPGAMSPFPVPPLLNPSASQGRPWTAQTMFSMTKYGVCGDCGGCGCLRSSPSLVSFVHYFVCNFL